MCTKQNRTCPDERVGGHLVRLPPQAWAAAAGARIDEGRPGRERVRSEPTVRTKTGVCGDFRYRLVGWWLVFIRLDPGYGILVFLPPLRAALLDCGGPKYDSSFVRITDICMMFAMPGWGSESVRRPWSAHDRAQRRLCGAMPLLS